MNASKYYRKNVVPLRAVPRFCQDGFVGLFVRTVDEEKQIVLESIKEMNNSENGFDAVIVCCSTEHQATYWGERLMQTRGSALSKKDALVYAVCEDWAKDGAGNGLGTLYAYSKAKQQAQVNKRREGSGPDFKRWRVGWIVPHGWEKERG